MPAARGVVIRAYHSQSEADADTRPPGPGVLRLIRIVTGVLRATDET